MTTLTLHADDGTQEPVAHATLAGLLDAVGLLEGRGAGRVRGCYVLSGRAGALESLLCEAGVELVLTRLCGRDVHEGEDLVHLGVRLAGQ